MLLSVLYLLQGSAIEPQFYDQTLYMTTMVSNKNDPLSNSSGNKIRVLLADDHPVVRTGLRLLLEKAVDIIVVAEAETGQEVLVLAEETAPDVIVLDMEMPELNGIEVVKRFRDADNAVQILVLSAHAHEYYVREVLSWGASGYLVKDEAPKMIVDAVRGTARGQKGWFSRSAAAEMSTWIYHKENRTADITAREREVMLLVAKGKTNSQIGRELDISEKTVEKHMSALLEKLDASSRVEVAVYAVRNGFI